MCVPGYAKKVRAVPAWLKRQAYAEYGITQYKTGDYKVDHLIPLSLGGSNSIRNLWPQSTKTSPWNSFVKDALERKLHKLVCAGQLDLETAQREIAADWIEAYKKSAGSTPSLVSNPALPKPCITASSQLPETIYRHRVKENDLLSLYPITSHNRCAKFGFLTQIRLTSGQTNLLLVRTLRTCRRPRRWRPRPEKGS